jgi:acyl-CoA thioester hydrolase
MVEPLQAEVIRKASFADLDPMNVVWHGNYVRYFEQARDVLLDSIGYNYEEMRDSGYMWPVVDLRVKYVRPIRFRQQVRITATLVEFENRLKFDYRIFDVATGDLLTKGQTTQLAVSIADEKLAFESPPILIEKVRARL